MAPIQHRHELRGRALAGGAQAQSTEEATVPPCTAESPEHLELHSHHTEQRKIILVFFSSAMVLLSVAKRGMAY